MTRATRMEVAYQDAKEDVIQASILQYLRQCLPDCIVAHVPNGGLRSKREAARLKWQGVLAGFPDLIVLEPAGRFYLLEVKTAKGALQPSQNAFRDHCERYDMPFAVVRSIDDARAALAGWGLVSREVPNGSEGGATPAEPNPTKTGERK